MKIVAIGISTGGPGIAEEIVLSLHPPLNGAIIFCMHMQSFYLQNYVERLNTMVPFDILITRHWLQMEKNRIYFCNGAANTLYHGENGEEYFVLRNDESFFTPNIDSFFLSLSSKNRVQDILAIILSGIGEDGVYGLGVLQKMGVTTIASDEKSSIVYGMPRRAKELGYADKILTLSEIIADIKAFLYE